jgi:hypothetical protein
MFFAIAVLLLQTQGATQTSFSAEKVALTETVTPIPSDNLVGDSSRTPVTALDAPVVELEDQPMAELSMIALPDAPVPLVEAPVPMPLFLANSGKPMTVSVTELKAENRRKQLQWKGLMIASSAAATFDAWSTRRAITTQGAQELDPLLRPFAGNASLYAAIQVGPLLMDYVGKKMMYSRHSWVRRMWWAPQSASFVSSIFCGAHNLSFHQ